MTYAILDKEGNLSTHDGVPTLDQMQVAVGGSVEVFACKEEINVWLNEEGKYPVFDAADEDRAAVVAEIKNEKATTLCKFHSDQGPMMAGDFIAGDVVLTGGPDDEGDTQGLSEGALKLIDRVMHTVVISIGAQPAAVALGARE